MGKEAVTLLVTALAVAGCLAPQDAETAAAEVLDALDLREAEGDLSAWYAVNATSGPEADLTAFWWSVPAGGTYKDAFFDEFDVSVVEIALEAEGGDPALTEWAVLLYSLDDGELSLEGLQVSSPTLRASMGPLPGGKEVHEPEVEPTHLRFWDVEEGDKVGIVVAARSEARQPLRVLLRTLTEDPGFEDDPAPSAAAFLAARDGAPTLLAASGRGSGLQNAQYFESSYMFGPYAYAYQTEAAHVEGGSLVDARPAASARTLSVSSTYDGGGWTYAWGVYWPGSAAGTWWAQADAHGETLEAGGPYAIGPLLNPGGLPGFVVFGEGADASRAVLGFEGVESGIALGGVFAFQSVSLGATLEHLLGEEARSGSSTFGGLLGGDGWHRPEGDRGPRVRLASLAGPDP